VLNTSPNHCMPNLNGNRLHTYISECNHCQSVTETVTQIVRRCAAAEAGRIARTSLMDLLPQKIRYIALNGLLSISPAQLANYNETELRYTLVLLLITHGRCLHRTAWYWLFWLKFCFCVGPRHFFWGFPYSYLHA
jgi:hypothetical protein